MLTDAIGDLLPSAIGVAVSPVPIIAVILMLGTPKARSNGPAFAAGWLAGLLVVGIVVLFVASGADDADSAAADGTNWVKVAIGVLFLFLAFRQWRKRPEPGQEAPMPAWMATVDRFSAGRSLVLGAVLSGVNPKNLALTAAAASTIAQAGLDGGESAVALGVFVVIASITVVGPVVFSLAAPSKASQPLGAMKEFMAVHNTAIMIVLFVVLGAKLIGDGWSGLG